MPTPYVKKLAKQTGKSVAEVERLWDTAKEQAAKAGHKDDYAYITGILNQMVGASSLRVEAATRLSHLILHCSSRRSWLRWLRLGSLTRSSLCLT